MKNKLMIVDDDPDILITMRYIFENKDYEVYTVDNGRDCLKELERGFTGIILMDIMMPFMDGWDTIREIVIKGLTQNVTILILSAKGTPNDAKIKGLEPYIQGYIPKPFEKNHLVSTVTKLLIPSPSLL
jgi:DNA-binding response OmpR family regulator